MIGAGGFIGSNLCELLVQMGAKVSGYGRSIRIGESLNSEVTWYQGHLSDRAMLRTAIVNQDIVFHLAGETIPEKSNGDVNSDFLTNTSSTISVLEECRMNGIRKIVFASSGGTVYGVSEHTPISEYSSTNPISAYGISKIVAEKYLELYRYQWGLDYHVLRIANPYGPFQSPFRRQGVVANMMYNAIIGKPIELWGTGNVVRDFVYVEDVTRAFCDAALYEGTFRVMNVGSGHGRTIMSVLDDIGLLNGVTPITVIRRESQKADVPVNVLDISLIGQEFGWHPMQDWMGGLQITADWMQSVIAPVRR
ncbi:NAD-dependent epimerase/dehydratase family protein [Methylobacterium indicum]|uniref:NAD-dependent epimerase/dehydratase family protein n=1 Tax=Methylobacterium indicum TaxID=1775910 RepID=UPI0013013436|nr:NAD-dependent epimerase/dehydratase family protein [Methylobacterium indicum]